MTATPITVPVTFPETPSVDSQSIQTQIKRPKLLNIYNQDTAIFNRLPSNRFDISSYDGFIDRNQQISNTNYYNQLQQITYTPPIATTTTQRPYSRADYDELSPLTNDLTEARHGHRKRRRRPCIPVYNHHPSYRANQKGNGRTLWDVNLSVLNVFPSIYDGHSGNYGGGGGDSSGGDTNTDENKPVYDHYGGYECIPNPHYSGHHQHNHHHHYGGGHGGGGHGSGSHGSGNYGSGSHGGDGDYDGVQDDYNRPSGGLLGFFGPGGLFDFTGGAGAGGGGGTVSNGKPPLITPGTQSDPVYNDDEIKPVFEINVHDTVQNLVI